MLQCKDINKIAELKNDFVSQWVEPDFIFSSLNNLCNALHKLFKEGKNYWGWANASQMILMPK
jgi:hypothetical protein